MVGLGDRVKDKVTGAIGVVISVTSYLNGCTRCSVQYETLKDGIPQEPGFFDDVQLALMDPGVLKIGNQDPGGPRPDPPKVTSPKR